MIPHTPTARNIATKTETIFSDQCNSRIFQTRAMMIGPPTDLRAVLREPSADVHPASVPDALTVVTRHFAAADAAFLFNTCKRCVAGDEHAIDAEELDR